MIRLALINFYWFYINLMSDVENFRVYLIDECNFYLIRCVCNFKGIKLLTELIVREFFLIEKVEIKRKRNF